MESSPTSVVSVPSSARTLHDRSSLRFSRRASLVQVHSSRHVPVKLELWGTLGLQFLRLVLWSIHFRAPAILDEDDHPLKSLSDENAAEVLTVATRLLREAKSYSSVGRVETRDDAESFFGFMSRNRAQGAGAPVSSFPDGSFPLLIKHSILPAGQVGEIQRNRLQQLAAAVCSIRAALSDALVVPMVERSVWRTRVLATDADIERALLTLGAPALESPGFRETAPKVPVGVCLLEPPCSAFAGCASGRLQAPVDVVSPWAIGGSPHANHSSDHCAAEHVFAGSAVINAAANSLAAGRYSMVPIVL